MLYSRNFVQFIETRSSVPNLRTSNDRLKSRYGDIAIFNRNLIPREPLNLLDTMFPEDAHVYRQ